MSHVATRRSMRKSRVLLILAYYVNNPGFLFAPYSFRVFSALLRVSSLSRLSSALGPLPPCAEATNDKQIKMT